MIPSLKSCDCIEEVVAEYSDMIYRLACSMTGSQHDAHDIVQDVLLKYIESNMTFKDEEHRKRWLLRVTSNQCKQIFRSRWSKTVRINETDIVSESTHANDKRLDIQNAMRQLPDKYKTILYLFYYEELPISQIASLLKMSEGTVKTRLMRGRGLMEKMLRGDYSNEG